MSVLCSENRKIAFIALGCDKNRIDLEIMLEKIKNAGYELCDDIQLADAVVINTCAFIDAAKQEAIDEILSASQYKKTGKLKALIVTGCLAQRYQDEILKEMPEVDAVVGLGENDNIVSIIEKSFSAKPCVFYGDKLNLPLDGDRFITTPKYSAYLKIAEGCSNYCTYCAIPMIRGKYRSRKKESIIEEAKKLATSGVKEINLIAQDPTFYGKDLYGKLSLADLLKELCKVDGIKWIRLLYCYPDRINDELLDVIKNEEKIVKYLDIPLQHCVKDILQAMNRYGDEKIISELINKIRNTIPDVAIRTTFIVGFPGEKEENFETLCSFIKKMQFEKVGCFAYSAEEGTKAATLSNQLDEETKESRLQTVYSLQYDIMQKVLEKDIGKTFEVLCEGYDESCYLYFGRRSIDAPDVDNKVYFSSENQVHTGDFVNVEIENVLDFDLKGKALV